MLFYLAIALLLPFSSGSLTLDEAFEVATGNVDGTCDPYRKDTGNGLLESMFEEMKSINANAIEELKNEPRAGSNDVRKLLMSFFGADLGREETDSKKELDEKKIEQMKEWFELVNQYFLKEETEPNKIELFCDSTFMVFTPMDHKPALDTLGHPMFRNGKEMSVGEVLSGGDPDDPNQPPGDLDPNENWAYWIPSQKVYLPLKKDFWGQFPSYSNRPNYPTYCADQRHLAWSVETVTGKPIIVLCPRSFRKKIYDKVNLEAQPVGKVLDTMGTKSLTWYHEMFHVAFPDEESPDADKWAAKKAKPKGKKKGKQVPVEGWPARKDAWKSTKASTTGGVMCMYLGLYDNSEPVDTFENLLAIKNPESYAWFGLALYMTTEGPKHQDWSTGACRDHDSPPARVTVTIDKMIPRQAVQTLRPREVIA